MKVNAWSRLGFDFNPFEHLEASEDPRLGLYLVERAGLAHIWEEVPAVLYAKSGAGKTALRMQTERLCWSRPYSGPLPVTYLLSPSSLESGYPAVNDHYRAMNEAVARSLFISILLCPTRFLRADKKTQGELASWLDRLLPARISHYIKRMESDGTTRSVIGHFDRNQLFAVPTHSPHLLADFLPRLKDSSFRVQSDAEPARLFQHLTEIALHDLGFRSIFLLVDGLDGTPETYLNPSAGYQWLAPLWEDVDQLTDERVYFKEFFPSEMDLSSYAPALSSLWTFSLQWTVPTLAQMLRKRIYVASGGRFGSLDAISEPILRDVETQMVRLCTSGLPREQLRFADMVVNQLVSKQEEMPLLVLDDLLLVKTIYESEEIAMGIVDTTPVTELAI